MLFRGMRATSKLSMKGAAIPSQFLGPHLRTVVSTTDPALQSSEMAEALDLLCLLAPSSKSMGMGDQIEQLYLMFLLQMNEPASVLLDTESIEICQAVQK